MKRRAGIFAILVGLALVTVLTGCGKTMITLRVLYTGDTVGYLEPCG